MRAYSNQYTDNIDENYIKTNFEKAIGHEYRAFFDTADFLSIVLRQKIAERLSQYSLLEIKSVWEEYDEIKKHYSQRSKRNCLFATSKRYW